MHSVWSKAPICHMHLFAASYLSATDFTCPLLCFRGESKDDYDHLSKPWFFETSESNGQSHLSFFWWSLCPLSPHPPEVSSDSRLQGKTNTLITWNMTHTQRQDRSSEHIIIIYIQNVCIIGVVQAALQRSNDGEKLHIMMRRWKQETQDRHTSIHNHNCRNSAQKHTQTRQLAD